MLISRVKEVLRVKNVYDQKSRKKAILVILAKQLFQLQQLKQKRKMHLKTLKV